MSATGYRSWVIFAAILAGTSRAGSAEPVVLYSHFGPAPGYIERQWEVSYPFQQVWASSPQHDFYYMTFQPTQSGQLSSLLIPIVWSLTLPTDIVVTLGDGVYPNAFETFRISPPTGAQTGVVSMLSLESSVRPLLEADTTYFLGIGSLAPGGAYALWPWNNAGVTGTIYDNDVAGLIRFIGTLGAFQVLGDPVPTPEPAGLILVATGLGLMTRRLSFHRPTP